MGENIKEVKTMIPKGTDLTGGDRVLLERILLLDKYGVIMWTTFKWLEMGVQ
jgi:hypothetical protein